MGKAKTSKSKSSAVKTVQSSASHSSKPVTPSWPPFRPPLPVTDLSLVSPSPGYERIIAVIHNFWPKSLCREYVNFLKTLPLTTTPGRPKRGEAVRQNDRFQVDDPVFSQKLWFETGLRNAMMDDSVKHLWYKAHELLITPSCFSRASVPENSGGCFSTALDNVFGQG